MGLGTIVEVLNRESINKGSKVRDQTGCPAQAKAIPPQVAETMTTTRSDMSLQDHCIR